MVVDCSTVQQHLQNMTFMEESSEENLSCILHHHIWHQTFAQEHLNKPDVFWKRVLWTDGVKYYFLGAMTKSIFEMS